MVPKIVLEHVKKPLILDNLVTRSKTGNEVQDTRKEKPAYADPIYRPLIQTNGNTYAFYSQKKPQI